MKFEGIKWVFLDLATKENVCPVWHHGKAVSELRLGAFTEHSD